MSNVWFGIGVVDGRSNIVFPAIALRLMALFHSFVHPFWFWRVFDILPKEKGCRLVACTPVCLLIINRARLNVSARHVQREATTSTSFHKSMGNGHRHGQTHNLRRPGGNAVLLRHFARSFVNE